MPKTLLSDRSVLSVSGEDATTFLNSLTTCAVERISPGSAGYGALLTPQGKIAVDFILYRISEDHYILDVDETVFPNFEKRLSMYRLRSKVVLKDLSEQYRVFAGWDEEPLCPALASTVDPRLRELGWRAVSEKKTYSDLVPATEFHKHRIQLGIPEGGKEFLFLETYPHEALMDQFNSLDFKKGCYIGQEVVSRIHHRGQIRSRILPVRFDERMTFYPGSDVKAGEKVIGKTTGGREGYGFAVIRLELAGQALKDGLELKVGEYPLTLAKYPWMRFSLPGC